MSNAKKSEFEKIFRTSNSSNELFDCFRIAIENEVRDVELYKTLLWNKALSPDEISMYSEKVCQVFPTYSYNIYLWVGKIFSTTSLLGKHYERAMTYFLKASGANPKSAEPLLAIAGIYNKELNIPPFEDVVNSIEAGLSKTSSKSEVCFVLSYLYREKGLISNARKYKSLGDKYKKLLS